MDDHDYVGEPLKLREDSIFNNWDKFGAEDYQLMEQVYNEAIKEVLEEVGGFPDVRLKNLPSYRTSKSSILKRIPREKEMQMVPKLPKHM